MVLAEKKLARHRDMNRQDLNRPRENRRKITKADRKLLTDYLPLIILISLLSIVIASRYTALARVGYNIDKQKSELARLQKEHELLQLEMTRLQSLDRIEKEATTRLGMVKPGGVTRVAVGASIPSSQQVVGSQGQVKQEPPKAQGYMERLVSGITALMRLKESEAKTLR